MPPEQLPRRRRASRPRRRMTRPRRPPRPGRPPRPRRPRCNWPAKPTYIVGTLSAFDGDEAEPDWAGAAAMARAMAFDLTAE
jgi:hypothetical protein